MKITLITATYNSAKNLRDCLQSVAEQTYPNIEHIVIDGGSTDETLEIIKATTSVTKYISEPDQGIYDALNKGIQLATGDVIGFVHSDDMLASPTIISAIVKEFLSPPMEGDVRRIEGVNNIQPDISLERERPLPPPTSENSPSERGINSFPNNNELEKEELSPARGEMSEGKRGSKPSEKKVHGVYGNLVFIDPENPDKIVRTWISEPFDRSQVRHGWMPPHPTLFLRREMYEKHGLFDTTFKIAGDYDFMVRIMKDPAIRLYNIPMIIVKMRKGGASTGNFKSLILKKKEDLQVMKKNGFNFPLWTLLLKNLRKSTQLVFKS